MGDLPGSDRRIEIAPSVLPADFARLGQEVAALESAGVDRIQWDVMDGRFVPNLTIGPMVVEAAAKVAKRPLDVHLMIVEPEKLIPAFVDAGAHILTVHAEACTHLHRTIQQIRKLGARPAVALNPATPPSAVEYVLEEVDMVLVMSVNPGFGGQRFIPTSSGKVAQLRDLIQERHLWGVEIEVDGGVTPETAPELVAAGATVLVAGAAIFNQERSVQENLSALRAAVRA